MEPREPDLGTRIGENNAHRTKLRANVSLPEQTLEKIILDNLSPARLSSSFALLESFQVINSLEAARENSEDARAATARHAAMLACGRSWQRHSAELCG